MEGLISLARKKDESTNEKIVRLYKEGYSIDSIARTMEIPKGNIAGILERYFPEYQSYVQPDIQQPADNEEKEKTSKKSVLNMNVSDLFKKGKKDKAEEHVDTSKVSINLDMDENGFEDRSVAGIAQMLKKGRSIADVAEFFNREKAEIKAVSEVMDEHFRRQELAAKQQEEPEAKAEPEKPEKHGFGRTNEFATGLENNTAAVKPAYAAPTYTKRDDPKPVSASYGLAEDSKPVSLFDKEEPEAHVDLVGESVKEEPAHEVKLVPDDAEIPAQPAAPKAAAAADEEIPEMPSIDPISLDALDKELGKTPDPVTDDIPDIGFDKLAADADDSKEDSGMSPMEKMKQFAQEQIALNNQKIEELKSKKVDAENNAFDCNTKVETMKKQIEDMQAQLLVLIDEKNKAGEIVSGINDEIESINQENVEFGAYL